MPCFTGELLYIQPLLFAPSLPPNLSIYLSEQQLSIKKTPQGPGLFLYKHENLYIIAKVQKKTPSPSSSFFRENLWQKSGEPTPPNGLDGLIGIGDLDIMENPEDESRFFPCKTWIIVGIPKKSTNCLDRTFLFGGLKHQVECNHLAFHDRNIL